VIQAVKIFIIFNPLENISPLSQRRETFLRVGLSIGALALLLLFIYFRANTPGNHLIPVSVVAIIAGVFLEGVLISTNIWQFVQMFVLSFAGSFIAFIPGKREHYYDAEKHIRWWPYYFIAIFAIVIITLHKKKIIRQLTEGVTLLQSAAVLYWICNYGFLAVPAIITVPFVVPFLLYALYHAFTYKPLSPGARLSLSIWSSFIMLFFAADHIYRVCQNNSIENSSLLSGYYIGLQYFLLGVSLIYSLQNLIMLMGFIPGKNRFFNEKYFEDLRELKQDHIDRYSDEQVHIHHAAYCLLFAYFAFGLNYYFDVLPAHMAIWIVFLVFPYLMLLVKLLEGRKNKSYETPPQSS
jgi:hypothetical protein